MTSIEHGQEPQERPENVQWRGGRVAASRERTFHGAFQAVRDVRHVSPSFARCTRSRTTLGLRFGLADGAM